MYIALPSTLAASLAFMLPIATASNAIAISFGRITAPDLVSGFQTSDLNFLAHSRFYWLESTHDFKYKMDTHTYCNRNANNGKTVTRAQLQTLQSRPMTSLLVAGQSRVGDEPAGDRSNQPLHQHLRRLLLRPQRIPELGVRR